MKRLRNTILAACAAVAALTAWGAAQGGDFADRKLMMAEQLIKTFYVDAVDQDKMVAEAITAMLKTLDPHSVYTDSTETASLTAPLEGKFSGIGVQFTMINDSLYVIMTTPGGPSERVGILPGDRILQAGDSVISGAGRKNTDILPILRGPKGTTVDLKVARGPERIDFRVVRDDIPQYSVDAAYMAAPGVGYVRLSRFAAETAAETARALEHLDSLGMQTLVLDLQDNGGGYLGSAFQLAEMFLRRGDKVVSTRGRRSPEATYAAQADGRYADLPLVVLVNQYSASASEILSGAVQDNDRGVIVGRRTFGKGLVQRPFDMPDGSMIRLTTARYYTPAGRSIQKPYTPGHGEEYELDMLRRYAAGEFNSADSVHFVDSLRYTTRAGRTVYGGGGIMPDVFVAVDTAWYSPYYRDLTAKGVINQWVVGYVDANRQDLRRRYPTEDAFYESFQVTEPMMQGLVERGVSEGVPLDSAGLARSAQTLRSVVRGLVARDLYDTGTGLGGGYYRSTNPLNPVWTRGLEVATDPRQYDRLLQPGE